MFVTSIYFSNPALGKNIPLSEIEYVEEILKNKVSRWYSVLPQRVEVYLHLYPNYTELQFEDDGTINFEGFDYIQYVDEWCIALHTFVKHELSLMGYYG